MGNSLSEEQCDNRCDKEMRSYQEMERILREKMNKMEDDLDEKDDECKTKLNDFEEDLKQQFNSAGHKERIIQEWISIAKENPSKKDGICDELCSSLKINKIEILGGRPSISEGFEGFEEDNEYINVSTLLLILLVSIIIIKFCD